MNMTRRRAMALLAVSTAGGVLMSQRGFAAATGARPDRLIAAADVCAITPRTTEGPYYFDPALERTDITEGRPGLPTTVRLQVVDPACRPISGARVDIWHCDALGIYSGYARQPGGIDATGETFMRGTQVADADGIVEFATVYPGWYPGRTPHIHFKVLIGDTQELTGQLFFPDSVSERVYREISPYDRQGAGRATRNDEDNIARRAGERAVATVEELPERYLVQLILGVEPPGALAG